MELNTVKRDWGLKHTQPGTPGGKTQGKISNEEHRARVTEQKTSQRKHPNKTENGLYIEICEEVLDSYATCFKPFISAVGIFLPAEHK